MQLHDFTRAFFLKPAALFVAGVLTACAAPNENAPLRSPSRDYQPPAATTADGETMGADGVSPSDRLQEGAHVGTDSDLSPGFQPQKREPGPEPARPSGPPKTDSAGEKE